MAEEVSDEKGYEILVKEFQNYLMFVLPGILETANEWGDLWLDPKGRIKRVTVSDINANVNLCASISRTQNIKHMRTIPPNILSFFSPLIKIYKVSYPEGNLTSASKHNSYLVPFDDNILSVGTSQTVSDTILTARQGTLDLANLVSFDFQYIGTNPAETEVCITSKMKLKFNSIDALLNTRTLSKAGSPDISFRYADLVNSSDRKKPLYYRIKAEVGYNVYDTDKERLTKILTEELLGTGQNIQSLGGSIATYVNNIIDAAIDSKVILFLYPVSHELNFNENGMIDLEINFHGAVDGSLSSQSSNVLLVTENGKKIYEEIKKKEKEKEDSIKAIETEYSGKTKGDDYEKKVNEASEKFDRELEKLYKDNKKIYNDFIFSLYSCEKIRSISYKKEKLGIKEGFWPWSDDVIQEDSNGEVRKARLDFSSFPLNYFTYKNVRDAAGQKLNPSIESIFKRVKQDIDKKSGNPNSNGAGGSGTGTSGEAEVGLNDGDAPNRINFIFLQDLLWFAIKTLDLGEISLDNIYLFLGNIVLPASKTTYNRVIGEAKNRNVMTHLSSLDPADPADARKIAMLQYNLGHIPIALEYFNKWFLQHIVNPGRIDWPLKTFLYDMMELIRMSVTNIFGKKTYGVPGSRTMLASTCVNKNYISHIETGPNAGADINTSDINLFGKFLIKTVSDMDSVANILYLYVPTLLTNNINPLNVADNEAKNVFTFTVGSNVGILKKISYKKMDIPHIREARMEQAGESAAGTLRMKYDCDIEMYGPSYFRPGDIIVVNPAFLSRVGTKDTSIKLANELGLGGVYMVLKTNTDISRDGVKTSLNTVFQNYGTLVKVATAAPTK